MLMILVMMVHAKSDCSAGHSAGVVVNNNTEWRRRSHTTISNAAGCRPRCCCFVLLRCVFFARFLVQSGRLGLGCAAAQCVEHRFVLTFFVVCSVGRPVWFAQGALAEGPNCGTPLYTTTA